MQPPDGLAHQHGQHDGGGGAVGLHEAHEFLGGQAEAVLLHVVGVIKDQLRQMIGHGLLALGHGETRGDLIHLRIGLEDLCLRHLSAVGADATRVVFYAVLHAVIVIQDGFHEGIDPLTVAEAVEHGKPGFMAIPGNIHHMIVGFTAAHMAEACRMHHLHGQRVFCIIDCAVVDDQGVSQIGHPLNGPFQGTLEQPAVNGIPVGNLHRIAGNIYRQIGVGETGNGHFLFLKVRTRNCHALFSSLFCIRKS